MNPLYNAMTGQSPQNEVDQMIRRFQQFKGTFQGDPRQIVQQLLASGKMTQAQYNQLAQMANKLYPQLK